jgi:chemotaxis protein MotB
MDPEKITSVGYGEARPVATNETAAGRARNRRIDLVIHPDQR